MIRSIRVTVSGPQTPSAQPAAALEVLERSGGEGTEDPVDLAAIETEVGEPGLEQADIVSPLVGRGVEQQPVTEFPGGLDERRPAGVIDDRRGRQPSAALELAQRVGG